MFTGIVQGLATIKAIKDAGGLRTFEIEFPAGFCQDLQIGASVAIDGVCLTVTEVVDARRATFDVMLQSLRVSTLGHLLEGSHVNCERAARDGAEIGGHPLSGHVDFCATILDVQKYEDNYCLKIGVAEQWMRYIFAKGYIALDGASLTVADVNKQAGWFEVWLIPETRRMTVFGEKEAGSYVNVEIERATQVVVDTVRATLEEKLGALLPVLEAVLSKGGFDINALASPDSVRQIADKLGAD